MPENIIDGEVVDGVVKLDEAELEKLNKGGVSAVDDATIQSLADKSGDTVEHIREMLNLADGKITVKTVVDDKLLAGKYKTEGDLDQGIQSLIDKYGKEKAYKMLESSMGKGTAGDLDGLDDAAKAKVIADKAVADKAAADALAADALSGDDAAKKAAAKLAAGEGGELNIDKYAEEFAENQKLSDTSYEELAKAGLEKEFVDSYIAGVAATAELYTGKIYEKAGGLDKYEALVKWGGENLNNAEKTRFNEAMNSQDLAQAGLVLDALSARMEKAEGTFKRAGVDINDNLDTGTSAVGYGSHQEMQTDMRDPRYKSGDVAFHAHVKARLAASTSI